MIRAIYRIDTWETYDMSLEQKQSDRSDQTAHRAAIRVGFIGVPADDLAHLVGRKLTDAPNGQNPISYLHT